MFANDLKVNSLWKSCPVLWPGKNKLNTTSGYTVEKKCSSLIMAINFLQCKTDSGNVTNLVDFSF